VAKPRRSRSAAQKRRIKETAVCKGLWRKMHGAQAPKSGKRMMKFMAECFQHMGTRRGGLGYVYQGTHHTWKAKRRGGR